MAGALASLCDILRGLDRADERAARHQLDIRSMMQENERAIAGKDRSTLRECWERDDDGAPCGTDFDPKIGHFCAARDEWIPEDFVVSDPARLG